MEKRVEYLDLARAVSIICVIWLHVGTVFTATDSFVHVFHMPIFFVMSGICFKDSVSFADLIKRKTKSLLLPYFFYATSLYLIWTIIYCFVDRTRVIHPVQFVSAILVDNATNSPYACVQWFFTALFFSNILFFALLRITGNNRALLLCGAIISGIVSYVIGLLPFRLPLSIDVALMSCFFMTIGYLIKEIILRWYMIPVLLSFVVATYIINEETIWNMRLLDYGNPILYMIGSVSLSVTIITICKYLSSMLNRTIMSSLCYIGRNSIWVLVYNQFYIQLIRLISEELNITIPNILIIVVVVMLMIPTILVENRISILFKRNTIGKT